MTVAAIAVATWGTIPANAQNMEHIRQDQWKLKCKAEQQILRLEEQMEYLEPENWAGSMEREYLANSLRVAYYSFLLFEGDHGRLPDNRLDLLEEGYIAVWPKNPWNGWKAMRILSLEEGFGAGDLCLQTVPIELTGEVPDRPGPNCFELGIYAPEDSLAYSEPPSPLVQNSNWTVVPEGMVYLAGSFYSIPGSGVVSKSEAETSESDAEQN